MHMLHFVQHTDPWLMDLYIFSVFFFFSEDKRILNNCEGDRCVEILYYS